MSSESLTATDSTRTDYTRCADCDSRESADSLNNLIGGKTDDDKCVEDCADVKCSLTDECSTSCENTCSEKRRKKFCCNTVSQCVWGVLLLSISIGGFIFTPLDFMLWEKLNMRPGFPPFDWWADPPDEVKLRVYVFNVTNHERFLSGVDEKMDVQEIGPIVYLEKLIHSNIRFNENSTMTYQAKRYPIFLPDLNHVDMNATLIVPNLAVLGIASYLHDANYLVRTGFRLIVTSHGSKLFVKKTVQEYLWDYGDPVLDTSKNLVPGLVPVNNMGMLTRHFPSKSVIQMQRPSENAYARRLLIGLLALPEPIKDFGDIKRDGKGFAVFLDRFIPKMDGIHKKISIHLTVAKFELAVTREIFGLKIYADFTDEVTVKIGPQWGHGSFFQIDRFRGEPQLPEYDPEECPDRIFGSSEGVMYRQHLNKNDTVLYWRKTVCKIMPLYFDAELIVDNVPVYRYNLSESTYDRVRNGTDCYNTVPSLPDGLSDGSKCYYDFPMVLSYPHFYTGHPPLDQYVTGLRPDRYKHNSYIVVEPLSGTPFRSVARMQSNLRVHDLSGFPSEYNMFSNLVIPLFWAEYNQEGLPSHIRMTIYFMTVILPPASYILLTLILLIGSYFIAINLYIHQLKNETINALLHFKSKSNTLNTNKVLAFEKEAFIKVPS